MRSPAHPLAIVVPLALALSSMVLTRTSSEAATIQWQDFSPPPQMPLQGAIALRDTRRDRTLICTNDTIWAVSSDPIPTWSRIWVGTPPFRGGELGYVYQPDTDRLWAYTGSFGTFFPQPGQVFSMDLGTSPLQWTERAYTGSAPRMSSSTHVYDPIRQRVIVFGGNTGCTGCVHGGLSILELAGTPNWVHPTLADPPGARQVAQGIYDPFRDRILIHGGVSLWPTVFSDTWALSLTPPMTWTQLDAASPLPAGRYLAITVLDSVGQRMILHGGVGPGSGPTPDPSGLFNDTWALDLSLSTPADSAEWSPIAGDPGDTRPPARWSPIGWVDPAHARMLRYGGSNSNVPRIDLWSLALTSDPAWTVLLPDSVPPPSRHGHVAVNDPARNRWIAALGSPPDVWARPVGERSSSRLAPGVPGARIGAGAVRDDVASRALVFGGRSLANPLEYYDDLWAFDLAGASWTPLAPPVRPSPRADALVVFDPVRRRILVHGGLAPGQQSDTWAYDVAANAWATLPVGGFGGRSGEAGAYDSQRDRLVAFGGVDASGTSHDDVHVLPLSGGAWEALPTVGTPPYAGHPASIRAAYDAAGDRLLVLATDFGRTLRVHALALDASPAAWSQLPVTGAPRGRSSYAFATSGDGTRLLVTGGLIDSAPTDESWELVLGDVPVPVLASLVSVDASPDGVRIAWRVAPRSGTATIDRRPIAGAWSRLGIATVDREGHVWFEDRDVRAGDHYEYRLGLSIDGVERLGGEVTVEVPLAPRLSLAGAQPNPVSGPLRVAFTLADRSPATLELIDIAGRRVLAREIGALGPGAHTLLLVPRRGLLASGLYFVRLRQGGEARVARVLVTP